MKVIYVMSNEIANIFAKQTEFTLQRYSFERAVRALDEAGQKIEALALIRAAYDCDLNDALALLPLICSQRG